MRLVIRTRERLADHFVVDVNDRAAHVADLVAFLTDEQFLPPLPPGSVWTVRVEVNQQELPHDLAIGDAGLSDETTLWIAHASHGAGDGLAYIAGGAAAAKLAVDFARVRVDAYRAKTERMNADLEREKFEQAKPEASETTEGD